MRASTEPNDDVGGGNERARRWKLPGIAKAGLAIYRQVAAVLAAFGLVALLGHFWEIGWRGILATLVGAWDATIRPVVEFLLHVVATVPLGWLGVSFEVPLWARDYLSVGVILGFSLLRLKRYRASEATELKDALSFRLAPLWIPATLSIYLLWPLSLPLAGAILVARRRRALSAAREAFRQHRSLQWEIFGAGMSRPILPLPGWGEKLDNRLNKMLDESEQLEALSDTQAVNARLARNLYNAFLVLISPILYLALLLALNFLLMPRIS